MDVNQYTNIELYHLLNLDDNPSDRVLEAKLEILLNKYENTDPTIYNFYSDVYHHFFHNEDENENENENDEISVDIVSPIKDEKNIIESFIQNPIIPLSNDVAKIQTTPTKRTLFITSANRSKDTFPISTDFSFNLTETLVNVTSIKLYFINLPYSWYTINNNFGSNFFYLKGNSKGINNGNFDYKISIPSGNYTASDFKGFFQTAIDTMKTNNNEINFGTTAINYSSTTIKLSMILDLTLLYNETNYTINFQSISSRDMTSFTTIPQLLGYTRQTYTPFSMYSKYSNIKNTQTRNPTNSSIIIYLYQGNVVSNSISTYTDHDPFITQINITLVGDVVSVDDIITQVNTQLQNNLYLSSSSKLSYIIDNDQVRYQLDIVFNRKTAQNGKNYKTCVKLVDNDVNAIWMGDNSLFNFTSTLNELSTLLSENVSTVTTYTPVNKSIVLSQKMALSFFHSTFPFFKTKTINITSGTYTSTTYINEINRLGKLASDFTLEVTLLSNKTPKISCTILPKANEYTMTLFTESSMLSTICGFPTTVLTNGTYNSLKKYNNSGYLHNGTSYQIKITNDDAYISQLYPIGLTDTRIYSGDAALVKVINYTFQTSLNSHIDLSHCSLTYQYSEGMVNFTLVVDIRFVTTTDDYMITIDDGILGFGPNALNFVDNSVISNQPFYTNQLLLTDKNNYFTIDPIQNVLGGVYTIDNTYQKTVRLTLQVGNSYTKEDIVKEINSLFQKDVELIGSYIDIDIDTGHTKFMVNVNKNFTTQDFRLVFFDDSFYQCNSYHSYDSVKSDTTLGWLLGYTSAISYELVAKNQTSDGNLSYYQTFRNQAFSVNTTTNVVTIESDSAINTSTVNAVFINLEDYCQNRFNDGLVYMESHASTGPLPSYTDRSYLKCNPITKVPYISNNKLTEKSLYSANQMIRNNQQLQSPYSNSNKIDLFATIPIKTSGLSPGTMIQDFSGSLQNQTRRYSGPVNIQKMSIQLLNDKGSILDLNGQNWSCSLIIEQTG